MNINKIKKALNKNNVNYSSGDSDETTLISWDDSEKIKEALKDLRYDVNISPGSGYGGGTIIYPKK